MEKRNIRNYLIVYIWLGFLSLFLYLELLLGATRIIDINKYWAHNIMICYLINILVFNIFKNKKIFYFISGIAFLWSIISHFVLQLHGSALCFSLFKNFKTAMTVIDNYSIGLDARTFFIIGVLIINVALVVLFPNSCVQEYFSQKVSMPIKLAFIACFVGYSIFSYKIATSNEIGGWAPFFIIEQRGYCSYLITDSVYCFKQVVKPADYDEKLIPTNITGWDDNLSETYPDIIVILNESFSDITQYSDVRTDIDPLKELQAIDNLIIGNCIVPNVGGGTNTSEYELLTSNSIALFPKSAPFNSINFEKHNASVVSYLEKYGYSTYAFHCFSKENYNRKIAYPALGFDQVYLGPDQFEFHNKNGNRDWLDEDNYQDIIRVYNESPESPKFMYLLTYQNHGGYEQNPSEIDTVHAQGEYSVSNEKIDEYLSSIKLSAEAFKFLTDYYKTVDRPVIICMLGDHTVSYSKDLNMISASREEKEIADRTVPYLIWANFTIDSTMFTNYTSIIDLMPSVLYASGIELDDYYKQILDMHLQIPGKTTFGLYIDNDGIINNISTDPERADLWNKYLFAEYKRMTN